MSCTRAHGFLESNGLEVKDQADAKKDRRGREEALALARSVDRVIVGKGKKVVGSIGNFFSFAMQFLPDGFLQMIFIDTNGFDKQHYKFEYVNREFLGEVRCLVFDVTPAEKGNHGRFVGRIWLEDQDYHVVRFNGGYGGNGHSSWYFHFDSWRTNVQPGLWLPTFVYSQESDLHYAISKKLDFKAQTRLWGYDVGNSAKEQELSKILVETPVQDDTKTANDLTPIQAQRSWDRFFLL